MRYPSIRQYIEALDNPAARFRTLGRFTCERDGTGAPRVLSGNNAAVFCIEMQGSAYGLKCFTRPSPGLEERYACASAYLEKSACPYLTPFRFLRDEIYVFDEAGRGAYYPVLLAPWVEGRSLGEYAGEKCTADAKDELERLAGRFDALALRLSEEGIAHGDLKHDNIRVTPAGELRLIDLDCLYVPELAGSPAPEYGSPAYQHPLRDQALFGPRTDDYSVAVISASLHLLALEPRLWFRYHDGENLLFDPPALLRGEAPVWAEAVSLARPYPDLARLVALLRHPTPVLPGLKEVLERLAPLSERKHVRWKILEPGEPSLAVSDNGRYGFVDRSGRIRVDFLYRDAKGFASGLAPVRKGDRWGYIDAAGRPRTPFAYEDALSFAGGRAAVKQGGLWGYLDENLDRAVPFRFEDAYDFRQGLARVRERGLYGYIDPAGHYAVPPRFATAGNFSEGVAFARTERLFGFIDRRGEWVVEPRYLWAGNRRGGRARVLTENGEKEISFF